MAKLNNEDIIASLKEMSILELNDLVKAIEEEFGVSAAAPVAAAAAAPVEASAPTEVSVFIKEIGGSKVGVIKVLKDITGLGMMEVNGLLKELPATIKENVKPEEAEEIKAKLVEAGAVVEIK